MEMNQNKSKTSRTTRIDDEIYAAIEEFNKMLSPYQSAANCMTLV
jgi:hypothetical protein